MAEKHSDPEHIGRVLHCLEQEYTQKWNINEREGDGQRERVDQERLGVVLWLTRSNLEIGESRDHDEEIERA